MLDIKELFPIPVGIIDNENIDYSEHDLLLNTEYHTVTDYGPTPYLGTNSQYVLDELNIPNTREFIETALKEYAIRTLCTEEPLRITNSWCIKYQNIPQILAEHRHPNSIISVAYYVSASLDQSAGLTLFKQIGYNCSIGSGMPFIMWDQDPKIMDKYQDSWVYEWQSIPARTGKLILFPSWMRHTVGGPPAKDVRCALSMNTWFVNPIGNDAGYTRLSL